MDLKFVQLLMERNYIILFGNVKIKINVRKEGNEKFNYTYMCYT